ALRQLLLGEGRRQKAIGGRQEAVGGQSRRHRQDVSLYVHNGFLEEPSFKRVCSWPRSTARLAVYCLLPTAFFSRGTGTNSLTSLPVCGSLMRTTPSNPAEATAWPSGR